MSDMDFFIAVTSRPSVCELHYDPGLHYRSLSRTIASTLDRTNYIEITPEVPPANAVHMLLDLLLP